MPDDGYSEVGGGGSIHWKVDLNDGEHETKTPKAGKAKGFTINGEDRKGETDVGRYFIVRIEDRTTVQTYQVGNDLVLVVPIKKKDGHIRARWSYDQSEIDGFTSKQNPWP